MRPVFADPKTTAVFKRIFGREAHKPLLIELLNDLLELSGDHRIVDLQYLSPEQSVAVEELKLTLVDVKCFDRQGRHYVVKLQVLIIEGFEKRLVVNSSKTYTQLRTGEDPPGPDDVVGVTICEFPLWPEPPVPGGEAVPMLSRWRMQVQHGGVPGLSRVQYVFLELPKYAAGDDPQGTIDRWAYFFRETKYLGVVSPALSQAPYREALEVARLAGFSPGELDIYERVKMSEQDARGALSLARRQGFEEGLREAREQRRREGLRETIRALCQILEIELGTEREAILAGMGADDLNGLQARLLRERRWD
jgi:predicted transposase/invertase (TIGR01784 family)